MIKQNGYFENLLVFPKSPNRDKCLYWNTCIEWIELSKCFKQTNTPTNKQTNKQKTNKLTNKHPKKQTNTPSNKHTKGEKQLAFKLANCVGQSRVVVMVVCGGVLATLYANTDYTHEYGVFSRHTF